MARSVRDVALGYRLLKGPDGIDGFAIAAYDAGPMHRPMPGRPLRVAWNTDVFGPIDPQVAGAVRAAAASLERLGCAVDEVRLPMLEETDCTEPGAALFAETVPDLQALAAGREDELSPRGQRTVNRTQPSLAGHVAAGRTIERLRSAFAAFFGTHDVLLCPVIPFTAPPHGQEKYEVDGRLVDTAQMMRATIPFNLTGLPALAVPFGFGTADLPLGVQVVGSWYDEDSLLRVGALIEAANVDRSRRPAL